MAPVDPLLVSLLACPVDGGPLLYAEREGVLYNPRLRLRYRVEGGVPLLAPGDGEAVGPAEHAALVAAAGWDSRERTGDAPDVEGASHRDPGEARDETCDEARREAHVEVGRHRR